MSESSLTPSADGPTRLIMMARVPVYGQVKSRLAKHVGKARALATHVELLNYNAVLAARSEMPFELHFVGDPRRPFFAQLAQSVGASLVEQVDGDIGMRMLAAARAATSPSLIIGSDCGSMTQRYLREAAKALETSDVVIGSAEDGGYVLIGQRTPFPELFTGVDWGTEKVVAQTRERARGLGVSVVELPVQWDVDSIEDWRRFQRAKSAQ